MSSSAIELVESGPLRYLVSVPPASVSGAPGVLCFLHGYEEAAPMPIEHALTVHGPLATSAPRAARERFLIVAPQLPQGGDVWHRAATHVLAVVTEAARTFGGDAERWFLTGFSFGGNGVFDLAAAQRGRWEALWAVDPTRVPSTALGTTPIWLSIGDAARRLTPRFVTKLGLERAAAPTAASAPDASRLYLDEGLDHVGSAANAYADARIYEWLDARASDVSRGIVRTARA